MGLIGCGWVAENGHLPALARIEEVELAALADHDLERLEALGGRYPEARACRDQRELFEDPTIEAVAVCVPAHAHVEVASAAAAAGKHVLIEKPPALGLDEWDRLAEAVAAAGVTLMVGFNMRRHPAFEAARDLVRARELGRVRGVQSVLVNDFLELPEPPPWRAERRHGGGALMEQGVHHLDLWRFILGEEIEEVLAVAEGDDDSVAIAARMRSGVPVSGLFSQRTSQLNEVAVFGELGHLRATPHSSPRVVPISRKPWTLGSRLSDLRSALSMAESLRTRRLGGFYVATFVAEWRQFLAAVRHGEPVDVGIDSARRLLQAALAVAASASEGRPVRCDDAPASLASVAGPGDRAS